MARLLGCDLNAKINKFIKGQLDRIKGGTYLLYIKLSISQQCPQRQIKGSSVDAVSFYWKFYEEQVEVNSW